jgi:hypothetical protein
MDTLCLTISIVSLTIISIITIILFVQYHRLKNHIESDFKSVVSQVNDVNDLNLNINSIQDNNIKSIDNNLNMLKAQLGSVKNTIYVPNTQLLVKKNSDGSILVCQPDGSSCRTLN